MLHHRADHVLSDEERELLARQGGSDAVGGGAMLSDAESDKLFDDEYPPPPLGYHLDVEPARRTNYCRLVLVLCSVLMACVAVAALVGDRSPSTCTSRRSKECIGDAVLAAMDRSADPCSNFYEYACGSWLRKQQIPPDRSSYSRSFSGVFDTIRDELRVLLEEDLQRRRHPNAIAGRFYSACKKGVAVGPLNIRSLLTFRPSFDSLHDAESFARTLAVLHSALSGGLFGIGVGLDDKHPDRYALSFGQGGLGLSHPNKYTSMKESDIKVRNAYVQLMQDHLAVAAKARLIPTGDFASMATHAFAFEKSIASISKPPEELRDPNKLYNPTQLNDFPAALHFRVYLSEMKIDETTIASTVIVEDPEYLRGVARMMARVEHDPQLLQAVKAYLSFHLVRHFASRGMMGEALYRKEFDFGALVSGVKEMPERWKICQRLTSQFLGDALGAAFVRKHFPKRRKRVAERLAGEITKSFRESLHHLTWMDDSTRQAAISKLSSIGWKVGYTKKFDTYPGVHVTSRTYSDNVLACMRYSLNYSLSRLGKPVDPTEWFMNAYEVNAYYSPVRNEMVFPAGILQQPFFSDVYPDAMNYGAIGSVIGHEMSHGFDDEGRKYDAHGQLSPWWSTQSAATYEQKAKCFVNLYNGYKPRSVDIYVKGNLTLGENLADTNGVKVAFHAFKSAANNSNAEARAPNPVLATELTNHQLFFVSYAQTWCTRYRPKSLKEQMITDPHSPGQFRVQGPLSQNPDFARAFNCKADTTYNPERRCSLW